MADKSTLTIADDRAGTAHEARALQRAGGPGADPEIESDMPIVVQHTRLASRQAEPALVSTVAYAGD